MRLNEKYGREVEVDSIIEQNMLQGGYTAIAYPADEPDILFRANFNIIGFEVSDNLGCKKVYRQITDKIGKNLNNLRGYFYVYCCPLIDAYDLDNIEMSIDEYFTRFPKESMNVYLHYVPEDDNLDNFYKVLSGIFDGMQNIDGMVYLSIVDEKTLGEIQDYIEEHDRIYDEYKELIKPFYKGNIRFRDSRIECGISKIEEMVGDIKWHQI